MKVAEWLFYIGIGSIAILFIDNGGDIEQFQSKATNFKIKQVPYTKRPVITVCPGHWSESSDLYNEFEFYYYKYSTDFNISIGSTIANIGGNSIKCSNYGEPGDYHTYDDCDYIDDSVQEDSIVSFVLEEVDTLYFGYCYKIIYDPYTIYDWKIPIQVSLIYNDSIPSKELPPAIRLYITSNENSHGIMFAAWMEGNELYRRFERKGQFGWEKKDYWMKIESSKRIFLEKTSNCSKYEAFYDCFVKKLIKLADFKNCTKKCLPSSWASTFPIIDSQIMPFCEEYDDDVCSLQSLHEFGGSSFLMNYLSLCPKSCSALEYTGSVDYEAFKDVIYSRPSKNTTYFSLVVRYKPPGTKFVYEEYLIVDFYGMVGVVGGTLGLFVGFSFFNVITFFIELIKRMYKKYKNPIMTEELISSNMVKVEENQTTQIQYILDQLEKHDKEFHAMKNNLFK